MAETTDQAPEVKYPEIEVQLTGHDGNAFMVIGTVRKALREGGATPADITQFVNEAMGGDYDNVLRTVMRWVQVS